MLCIMPSALQEWHFPMHFSESCIPWRIRPVPYSEPSANAMYLPKVIAFNAKDETAKKRYAKIADVIGLSGSNDEEKVKALISYVRGLNDKLKIPHGIKNYGADSYPTEQGFVPENIFLERLHDIAVNAIADACTGSNPRQPSVEEMEKLLKCCYYDTEVDF